MEFILTEKNARFFQREKQKKEGIYCRTIEY